MCAETGSPLGDSVLEHMIATPLVVIDEVEGLIGATFGAMVNNPCLREELSKINYLTKDIVCASCSKIYHGHHSSKFCNECRHAEYVKRHNEGAKKQKVVKGVNSESITQGYYERGVYFPPNK